MKRQRGRPARQYRLRVRTVRRDLIDFDALARAALEQAAMDHQDDAKTSSTDQHQRRRTRVDKNAKDARHDRLA